MKVVEAFIAILMITGVVLVVINKGYIGTRDISKQVFEIESATLKEIERNDILRDKILTADNDLNNTNEINLESHKSDGTLNIGATRTTFPSDVWNKINERIISKYGYLNCYAKICELNKACALDKYPAAAIGKDVFSQNIAVTVSSATVILPGGSLNPKQLKLFCWER